MKILLINRVFSPDTAGTARFATDLSEDLVKAGHTVSVLAGPPTDELDSSSPSYISPFFPRSFPVLSPSFPGLSVCRIPTTRFARTRILGWAVNAISFYPGALWKLLTLPRHDIAIFLTDPPMIYALGPLVRWLKGSRFVCWSMDVYPDVAVQAGHLRTNGLIARLSSLVARWALRRADLVIALGEVMSERLARRGIPAGKIAVVHNWADASRVFPVPDSENTFAAENGLLGKFVVAYSGNMGLSHEFSTLLEAARRLASNKEETIFLFIGSGKQAERLRNEACTLSSVRFLPYQPEARLAEVLSSASVQVVTMKPGMEGTIVPSKFYSALAAARPVLFIGPAHSEPVQIIDRARCGLHVRPGDIDGLLAAIESLRGQAGRAMGQAGHALFLKEFERHIATTRINKILTLALSGPTS